MRTQYEVYSRSEQNDRVGELEAIFYTEKEARAFISANNNFQARGGWVRRVQSEVIYSE